MCQDYKPQSSSLFAQSSNTTYTVLPSIRAQSNVIVIRTRVSPKRAEAVYLLVFQCDVYVVTSCKRGVGEVDLYSPCALVFTIYNLYKLERCSIARGKQISLVGIVLPDVWLCAHLPYVIIYHTNLDSTPFGL
eukprot:1324805-Pyramimonas_sp.AAC.3